MKDVSLSHALKYCVLYEVRVAKIDAEFYWVCFKVRLDAAFARNQTVVPNWFIPGKVAAHTEL